MDSYQQVMEQVDKLAYTPHDVRKLFEEKGFEVPLNPSDPKLEFKDHKGKEIKAIDDVWYNDRVLVCIANSPMVDTYNESVKPEALREALTHHMTPLDKGGAGGELSWAHGQWFPAGKVLGVSDILEEHGLYPVLVGMRSDTPMSDEVWGEVKELGFDMGFSIGMDPFSVERDYVGFLANVTKLMIDELAVTPNPANDVSRTYGWPQDRKGMVEYVNTLSDALMEKGYQEDLAITLAMKSQLILQDQAYRTNLALKGGIIRGMDLKGVTLWKKSPDALNELIVTGLKDQIPGLDFHLAKLRNSGIPENSALQTIYKDLEALTVTKETKKEQEPKDTKDMEAQEQLQEPELANRVGALEEQMAQMGEKLQAVFDTVTGEKPPEEGAPPEDEEEGKEAKKEEPKEEEKEEDTQEDQDQDEDTTEEEEKAEEDEDLECDEPKKPKRSIDEMTRDEIVGHLAEMQGGEIQKQEDPRKPKSLAKAGIDIGKDTQEEPTMEEVSKAIDEVGLETVLEEADQTKKQ